jgi:hypothetical protein
MDVVTQSQEISCKYNKTCKFAVELRASEAWHVDLTIFVKLCITYVCIAFAFILSVPPVLRRAKTKVLRFNECGAPKYYKTS